MRIRHMKYGHMACGLAAFILSACVSGEGEVETSTRLSERPAEQTNTLFIDSEPVIDSEPALPVYLPESPSILLEKRPGDVFAILDAPTLIRRDGDTQIALFEGDLCVVEIVFYVGETDGYFRSQHITARDMDGNRYDLEACLKTVTPAGRWPERLVNSSVEPAEKSQNKQGDNNGSTGS